MNFGIQISWVVVNIITISLFSMLVKKRFLSQYQKSREAASAAGLKHATSDVGLSHSASDEMLRHAVSDMGLTIVVSSDAGEKKPEASAV